MRRQRENRKHVRVIISLSLCLLMIMTIGYAAFSTNLTLTAKGNIKTLITIDQLKNKSVTTGEGLYQSASQENRYIYKGAKPNNYIKFNDELWRIIAIENDNTLKIMRNKKLDNDLAFDSINNRAQSTNTFCLENQGCNVWGAVDGIYSNASKIGTVTKDSSLNTYLNTDYYDNLSSTAKELIINHEYNVGAVNYIESETFENLLEQESKIKWNGKIGLISVSDYLNASLNNKCTNVKSAVLSGGNNCANLNYMYIKDQYYTWLINPYYDNQYRSWFIFHDRGDLDMNSYVVSEETAVVPVLFLKSDIKLMGSGTETDPYIIK